MQSNAQQPPWSSSNKPGSLRAYALWLRDQARVMFLRDKTHVQLLFLFNDDGLVSLNPIPPDTQPDAIAAGVREAVREHALYGVVTIAEIWAYFPKSARDHTVVQLHHGEMRVADLDEQDRREALMVRMENRDGEHVTWLDTIQRDGESVTLGKSMELPEGECLNLMRFFV